MNVRSHILGSKIHLFRQIQTRWTSLFNWGSARLCYLSCLLLALNHFHIRDVMWCFLHRLYHSIFRFKNTILNLCLLLNFNFFLFAYSMKRIRIFLLLWGIIVHFTFAECLLLFLDRWFLFRLMSWWFYLIFFGTHFVLRRWLNRGSLLSLRLGGWRSFDLFNYWNLWLKNLNGRLDRWFLSGHMVLMLYVLELSARRSCWHPSHRVIFLRIEINYWRWLFQLTLTKIWRLQRIMVKELV